MKIIFLILTMFIGQVSMSQDSTEMVEIKFVGTYTTGRTSCEWLLDGSRRWAITKGFYITKILKGNFEATYVEIDHYIEKHKKRELKSEQEYLVVIKLTENRIIELGLNQVNTMMTYKNPIKNEEILKIEEVE